jgi:hypothetical protein
MEKTARRNSTVAAGCRTWTTTSRTRRSNAAGSEATDRKLRLFACACFRAVWDLIAYDWGRRWGPQAR